MIFTLVAAEVGFCHIISSGPHLFGGYRGVIYWIYDCGLFAFRIEKRHLHFRLNPGNDFRSAVNRHNLRHFETTAK